ncbi:16S rRNA (adenine(1518)-N(6)/adenine(1519)-N(6))-dimethyltransferase RsmA [Candidatus Pelagibacter sp. HIMB1483]|uniref:16S rRNA (adenine(1518)-N(6)/adenine(1519)-N(6))- dimethyltransferase RsmA n=1 Tax=Candidatus Pelagibacter sp. HIMB1483 TaxID=3415414 RepID=UPI003F82CE7F
MIKPKKSLGQNFLNDKNILAKIVSVTKIDGKSILEVGPGTGNLTSYILKKNPKKIFLIEKDKNLISILINKFKDQTIINDDILRINEKKICKEKLTVFGNLPYNISTEILCKWILNLDRNYFWFDSLVLMFQKEVANRIVSETNTSNYGRLSVLANWKLDIKKICDIKPSSFFPKPKIDSSLLIFKPKKKFHNIKNSKNLETITKVFFNQRRKMLKKPYNQLFNGNFEIAKKLNIDLNLRPQNLSHEIYYELTEEYENL